MKLKGSIVGPTDPVWGNITGDIEDQTDLIEYFDDHLEKTKEEVSILESTVYQEIDLINKTNKELHDFATSETENRIAELNRQKADYTNRIETEATNRYTKDYALESNMNQEANIRKAGDDTLEAQINTEAETRSTADTEIKADYNSKFSNEQTARENADATLDSKISLEVSNRTSADTALRKEFTDLNATEASNRLIADNTLQANIDAQTKYNAETYSTISNTGYSVKLFFDDTTYALNAAVYDAYGNLITASETITLPIGELFQSVSYDVDTNELVFVFEDPDKEPLRVSLGSMLSGIATTAYVDNVANTKQNVLIPGQNITLNGVNISTPTYKAGDGIEITSNSTDTERTIKNTYYSAVWGNVQGTLSNQKDLKEALDLKQNDICMSINDSGLLCVEVEE